MACRNNHLSAARILIDNGANPFIEDFTGLNAFNNIKDRKTRLEFVNSIQDNNISYRYKQEELNNLESDINIESKFYRAYKYNNQIVNYYEISSERSYNFTVNEDVYILLKITARNRDFNIVDNEVNIKLYFPYFGEDNYKITFEKGDLLRNYISGNKIVCELKIYLYDEIYNQSRLVENEILIKLNSKINDDIPIILEFPRAYNKNDNQITVSFKTKEEMNMYNYYNIY